MPLTKREFEQLLVAIEGMHAIKVFQFMRPVNEYEKLSLRQQKLDGQVVDKLNVIALLERYVEEPVKGDDNG